MFGDSFFTAFDCRYVCCSIVGGVFVPMFGDSFFTRKENEMNIREWEVFVPMFGDSFFTSHKFYGER